MFDAIRVVETAPSQIKNLVVGVFAADTSVDENAKPAFDAATAKVIAAAGGADNAAHAIARPEFEGSMGSVIDTFSADGETRIVILGLGKASGVTADTLRFGGGVVGRRLATAKATSVTIELLPAIKVANSAASGAAGNVAGKAGKGAKADASTSISAAVAGSAFGEGLGLIGWVCDEFKGTVTKKKGADGKEKSGRTKLDVFSKDAGFAKGVARGLGLAEAANLCRTLSQTPPNIATTGYMAEQAKKLAKKTGLKFSIIEGEGLEKERMTGLINVGKASENKPCLVRLEYRPKDAKKDAKPLVLVGKTMTYDTGGLSLKINNGMVGMKRDKDGGCAVLGAMHAIATVIQPKRPVVALLSIAENSISDEAYRPDDVITYRNGVTVEVTNTDAEGRLVLADALCWACEKENPSAIIDLATLTGGVVVALGSTYCGMFCEDDALRGKVEAASKASGERVWRLPMHQEYRDLMKSPVADIQNSNANRKAHPIQGAAFLSYFVDEKVPWCHLDIAGVHVADSNKGPFVDGPTGWGTRLLAELVDA